jgi:hypothetical protein
MNVQAGKRAAFLLASGTHVLGWWQHEAKIMTEHRHGLMA